MKRYLWTILFLFSVTTLFAQTDPASLREDLAIIAAGDFIRYSQIKDIKEPTVLRVLRNAIYARHGYTFHDQELLSFFSTFSWYVPTRKNVNGLLTENDKENLETITYLESQVKLISLVAHADPRYSQPLTAHEKELIGIWQPYPIMAAMWGECYAFYPNHKVIYRTNKMDCARRLQWKVGNWRIVHGKLSITYTAECRAEGGKMVPSAGSCGSKETIVHSIYRVTDKREKVSLTLGEKVVIDEPVPKFKEPMTLINGWKYWKLRGDPTDY